MAGPQEPERPERSALPEPERPRRSRRLPILLSVLVILVAVAYLAPAALMSDSVLRGTRVGGVDIGGLKVTEAADRLREQLAAKIGEPIPVLADRRELTVDPVRAGMALDVVSTIQAAQSGFPSPPQVWRALTGGVDLEPRVTIGEAELARAVGRLAAEVDKEPREGRVAFRNGEVVAYQPREGRVLDQRAAVEAIRGAFLAPRVPLSLPMVAARPKTAPEAVEKATVLARKAVQEPITLTMNGRQVVMPVATIAAHLAFVADGAGDLRPRFDARKALAGLESSLIDSARAPRDAGYEVVNGALRLVPAREGEGVDDRALAAAVVELVLSGGSRTIPVEPGIVAPRVGDAEIKRLGIKEKVSEFTTAHPCCAARVTNIHTMADAVDGHLVRPGETFSLNGVVGERTAAKGYLPAGQIVGNRTEDGVGGGVSQFATTLFNAAYRGGFEDVEHMAHSYYISRYPAGIEATVFWPSVDLKWRNDSAYGVLIKTAYTGTSLTVSLWSTRRYDKVELISGERRNVTPFTRETSDAPGCQPMGGGQGFTVDVTRTITHKGAQVARETKSTVYRPQLNLVCTRR